MAVNLVQRYPPEEARSVLGRSFAQFQADAAVAGDRARLEQRRQELQEATQELAELVGVSSGDPIDPQAALEYLDLVAEEHRLGGRDRQRRAEVERSLARLRPGDVLERRSDSGAHLVVVVSVAQRRRSTHVQVLTARGKLLGIDARSEPDRIEACGSVQLPVPYAPNDAGFRKEAALRLRRVNRKRLRPPRDTAAQEHSPELQLARDAVAGHPLHVHPRREELLGVPRRVRRCQKDTDGILARIARRGTDLVARFDAVVNILNDLGHLQGWNLTRSGARLRRIYHECDLLLCEAVERGLFEDLEPAGIAALVSCVTHEHRSADPPPPPRLPTRELQARFEDLSEIAKDLARREALGGLPLTREPSAGFALPAYRWVGGMDLEQSMDEDMTGGDFVRNARQLIDVLRQIADVTTGDTAIAALEAATLLRRDVVEAGGGPQ